MSVDTFLSESIPSVRTTGLTGKGDRFISPSSAPDFISSVHKSRMHIYAQISDISKFGFTK